MGSSIENSDPTTNSEVADHQAICAIGSPFGIDQIAQSNSAKKPFMVRQAHHERSAHQR
jgi:hypothetical protein